MLAAAAGTSSIWILDTSLLCEWKAKQDSYAKLKQARRKDEGDDACVVMGTEFLSDKSK